MGGGLFSLSHRFGTEQVIPARRGQRRERAAFSFVLGPFYSLGSFKVAQEIETVLTYHITNIISLKRFFPKQDSSKGFFNVASLSSRKIEYLS